MLDTMEEEIPLLEIETTKRRGDVRLVSNQISLLRTTFRSLFFKRDDERLAPVQKRLKFSLEELANSCDNLNPALNHVFACHASEELKNYFEFLVQFEDKYIRMGHILLAKLNSNFSLSEDSTNKNFLNNEHINAILNIFITGSNTYDQLLIGLCISAALAEKTMSERHEVGRPHIVVSQGFIAQQMRTLHFITDLVAMDNKHGRAFTPIMASLILLFLAISLAVPTLGASFAFMMGFTLISVLVAVLATLTDDHVMDSEKYEAAKDYFSETKNNILEEKFFAVGEFKDKDLASRIKNATEIDDVTEILAEFYKADIQRLTL